MQCNAMRCNVTSCMHEKWQNGVVAVVVVVAVVKAAAVAVALAAGFGVVVVTVATLLVQKAS